MSASSLPCSVPPAAARPRCCACLRGFETPDDGRVMLAGQDLAGVPPYRRPVNMMFQSYALFPHLTVAGNVAFGLKQDGLPKDEIASRVDEMLALIQLSGFGGRRPDQLSGGQRQRVRARAIARQAAEGPSARRAARRARSQAARGDALRAQGATTETRHHLRDRHARSGRGDGACRPHRRDGPRQDRAMRHAG